MMDEKSAMEAYRAGFEEGHKHMTPSSETLLRMETLEKSIAANERTNKQFRNRVIGMIIALLFPLVGYGIWIGTTQSSIKNNREDIEYVTNRVESLGSQHQASEVALAEIKAKLANIETLLIELKNNKYGK